MAVPGALRGGSCGWAGGNATCLGRSEPGAEGYGDGKESLSQRREQAVETGARITAVRQGTRRADSRIAPGRRQQGSCPGWVGGALAVRSTGRAFAIAGVTTPWHLRAALALVPGWGHARNKCPWPNSTVWPCPGSLNLHCVLCATWSALARPGLSLVFTSGCRVAFIVQFFPVGGHLTSSHAHAAPPGLSERRMCLLQTTCVSQFIFTATPGRSSCY